MTTAQVVAGHLKTNGMFVNSKRSFGPHGLHSVRVEQWPTHVLIVGGGAHNAGRILKRMGYQIEPTDYGVKVVTA
jgi:hypothetical protein